MFKCSDVSLHCWMAWSEFHTWDAVALLGLACLTVTLCSAVQFVSYLPVSLIYTGPHSWGIWYTISFLSSRAVGVLTWVRRFLRFCWGFEQSNIEWVAGHSDLLTASSVHCSLSCSTRQKEDQGGTARQKFCMLAPWTQPDLELKPCWTAPKQWQTPTFPLVWLTWWMPLTDIKLANISLFHFLISYNSIPSCHVTCSCHPLVIYPAVTLILHVLLCTTEENPLGSKHLVALETVYHMRSRIFSYFRSDMVNETLFFQTIKLCVHVKDT